MNSCDLLWQGRVIAVVVEISAFSVHVHPLFDLMFVVSSIPRLHTAANSKSEIIEFPWEWNLIENGGFDADEAGTSLTCSILFWWEAVYTNEQWESINGRSTGSPLQMSRKPKIRPTSSCMGSFRPDLTGSHQMTSSIKRQKKGACIN